MSTEEVKSVARLVSITRTHIILDLLVEDLEVQFASAVNPGQWFAQVVVATITKDTNGTPKVTKIQKYEPKAPAAAPPPSGGK